MSEKITLGGERLGSGKKQKVDLRAFSRSTFDQSYVWKSDMACGTLVPFMSDIVMLPGDTAEIDLYNEILTPPSLGPLFGSFKVQLDVFQIPMSLYIGKIQLNQTNIGREPDKIFLPQIQLKADFVQNQITDNSQINPSSLFSYLNIRGLGVAVDSGEIKRDFNATNYYGYFDIYRNYYANKQLETGVMIHNDKNTPESFGEFSTNSDVQLTTNNGTNWLPLWEAPKDVPASAIISDSVQMRFKLNQLTTEPGNADLVDWEQILITITLDNGTFLNVKLTDMFENYTTSGSVVTFTNWIYEELDNEQITLAFYNQSINSNEERPQLLEFPLDDIDKCIRQTLKATNDDLPVKLQDGSTYNVTGVTPDNVMMKPLQKGTNGFPATSTQEGLLVKCYQSDLFNNWLNTEWIDGANGVNEISSVAVEDGKFSIDSLNLANRVFNLLNRIAYSGGTYDDWLTAAYTSDRARSVQSPIYHGGLIKELAFQQVISQQSTEFNGSKEPLGTLAGRGQLTEKNKGGYVKIQANEPSMLLGLISITPRVDYSQGNAWSTNLKNFGELHNPNLSNLGFQDVITDQMAWFDTIISPDDKVIFSSAGKQPAWINYMTNINKCYGNFAKRESLMFMTLNRRYEHGSTGNINDLTTYIDPQKFNFIFSDTRLDAMNFWSQVGVGLKIRRKMSSKVIPNL